MVQAADPRQRESRPVLTGRRLEVALILAGGACLAGGLAVSDQQLRIALLASGIGLITAMGVHAARDAVTGFVHRRRARLLTGLIATDSVPAAITDRHGAVSVCNRAAEVLLGASAGVPISAGLDALFAAPARSARNLLVEAAAAGSARTDRVSQEGHCRVSVVAGTGGMFLWRIESLLPEAGAFASCEIGVPLCVARPDGAVLGGNARFEKLVGEILPATLAELLGPSPVVSGEIRPVATSHGPVEMRVHLGEADPQRRSVLTEVLLLPVDQDGGSRAGELFETLPVPMIKVTADGLVIDVNQSAGEILGRRVAKGSRLSDLLSGLGRPLVDWLRDALAGRGLKQAEFLQVRGHESDRFVQVSLKRIEEGGRPVLLAVLSDATELKTLEAQFVQSQKMQAIGQLAGGVAHDFNNLLTAISGHCDLLMLRHDEGDLDYADLVQINQNANRAAALVGQLLAFSRKQTMSPEVVDLRDALSELTHLLSRLVGEPIRLHLRYDDGLPRVRVDRRQLEQVIMNLVVNARDAMPEGGEIVLETEAMTLAEELRRNRAAIPAGSYAVVRVRDTGVGIPPENLQKIFEPFFTTKKTGEGTGLGLSTVYGIVKQTGGFIFADSTPGEGTVFTLYFPAHTEEEPEEIAPPPDDPTVEPARGDGVVLLVEDEAPVRAFASRALKMRGYTVIEAESAEEALARLEDPDLEVDVFVTDVVMPGMDGPTWVRRALRDRPDTRVVFTSGYAEEALAADREQIPNSVFLPKPFSLRDLTELVRRQLH